MKRAFGLGEMLPDQQGMFAAKNELQFGDETKGENDDCRCGKWNSGNHLEKWDSNNNRYMLRENRNVCR